MEKAEIKLKELEEADEVVLKGNAVYMAGLIVRTYNNNEDFRFCLNLAIAIIKGNLK